MTRSDTGTFFLWWLFAGCFAADGAFHLLRTLYLFARCKVHGRASILGTHELSWFLIAFSATAFISTFEAADIPGVPLCISAAGWFAVPSCVIIQKKLTSMKSWPDFLEGGMDGFFDFFEELRSFFMRLEVFAKKHPTTVAAVLIGVCACLFLPCALIQFQHDSDDLLIYSAPMLLFFLLHAACSALHSCRKLLCFWFTHGALLACLVAATMSETDGGLSGGGSYLIFVIALSTVWIVMAGAADDDAAKMAAAIVNTGTTILAILVNVLVGWGLDRWAAQAAQLTLMNGLQFYGNLILLPLIVSGYLSALLKEMQIYRKARRAPPEIAPSRASRDDGAG